MQEDDLEDHHEVTGGAKEICCAQADFHQDHPVAADAVDAVADTLAVSHGTAGFSELEDAVNRVAEEEKTCADDVDDVRVLDGYLEEAHRSPVGDPADLAWEQDYAQAEDAAQ